MPQILSELKLDEISLVDKPANSSVDPKTGKKVPRAVIALYKRDTDGKEEDEVDKGITVSANSSGSSGNVEKDITLMKGAKGVQFVIGFKGSGAGSQVQSVLFDRENWDEDRARKWLADHDMKSGKIDTTTNTLRFRQADPAGFSRFRVIRPGAGKRDKHDYGPGDKEIWDKDKCNKGEGSMTLEELEDKVSKQDEAVAALTARNVTLDAENAMVIKMSKKARKLYAGMSEDTRKEFMAGDKDKRRTMMTEAKAKRKEKKLEDSMDEACKAEYAAAGPVQKAALLHEQELRLERVLGSDGSDGFVRKARKGSHDSEDDGDGDEDEDDDDEDNDGDGDDREKHKRKLQKREYTVTLRSQLAAAEDRIAKGESELEAIRKRERDAHFVKRAETELPNTPGSPAEKGQMLQKLAESFGEESQSFRKLLGDLKNADKILGDQFSEIGKAARGELPALAVFDAKVEEISKRDKIDKPHAVAKAMEEAPELYLDYERNQRQVVARV